MEKHLSLDYENCTGCGACLQKCPVQAISFIEDDKGFYYPEVNINKCVNCGLCISSCQIFQPESENNILGAYAVQINDKKILHESTSGGLFSAVSEYVLSKGGVVYGCILDEDCKATYSRALTITDLYPMKGSKYVWADASKSYKNVLIDLNSDKNVLFSGLPCQVEGLLLFLGKKYEKLYTIDFLCGGPPSSKVFNSYISSFTSEAERKTLDFKFRDKDLNGTGYCISYVKNKTKRYIAREWSSYYYLFTNKYVQRKSCYHCQFRGIHRSSDITMGDYWGVQDIFPDWNYKEGVSIAKKKKKKGERVLEYCKNICKIHPTYIKDIAKYNIIRPDNTIKEISVPKEREGYFKILNKYGYNVAAVRYTITIKRIKAIIIKIIKKYW